MYIFIYIYIYMICVYIYISNTDICHTMHWYLVIGIGYYGDVWCDNVCMFICDICELYIYIYLVGYNITKYGVSFGACMILYVHHAFFNDILIHHRLAKTARPSLQWIRQTHWQGVRWWEGRGYVLWNQGNHIIYKENH